MPRAAAWTMARCPRLIYRKTSSWHSSRCGPRPSVASMNHWRGSKRVSTATARRVMKRSRGPVCARFRSPCAAAFARNRRKVSASEHGRIRIGDTRVSDCLNLTMPSDRINQCRVSEVRRRTEGAEAGCIGALSTRSRKSRLRSWQQGASMPDSHHCRIPVSALRISVAASSLSTTLCSTSSSMTRRTPRIYAARVG